MKGNYKKWLDRIKSKQDVLTEDNVGEFMDLELSTKSTPTSGDTVLGRDSVTGKAVKIPTDQLGGNVGTVDLTTKLDKGNYTGTAQDLKNSIDNLQIGGRNHYKNSSPITPIRGLTIERNGVSFPEALFVVGTPDYAGELRINNVINSNGWWTISWDMRGSQSEVVGVDVDICDLGKQRFNTTSDNTWKRFSLSVNVTNYGDGSIYNFVDFSQFSWAYFYIKNIKIEQGNKATDWTPAPEDKQDRLQNISGSIGIGKTDASATEKLDVNGNVKANGFKTPNGTATQALTSDGGTFNLNTIS